MGKRKRLLLEALIFNCIKYSAVKRTVFVLFVVSSLFETLYKKIFFKKARIFSGQGFTKLWINKEEIIIKKGQITDIKAQVSLYRTRYGGWSTSTKLIIYTTLGKFHFTNNQVIYKMDKVLKMRFIKKEMVIQ
ncbi:hypothetical protein [Enterococcus sp. AZ177]|uniref:hypothetical protein n=1 Tax=unclassified Enterococcus TaxID=2608891 RepID=UPI003D2FDFA0